MKRGREERFMAPQRKRRGESSGLHQPSERSQRLSIDDTLAYLKAVREIFKDNREKYDEFLEVMKAFMAQRLDTAGVTARVRDLFKGHHSLILDFYTFLPEGYEITIPSKELPTRKQLVEFHQAINYVNKIKTQFPNNDLIYKNHLDILTLYRKGNKSIHEVHREVETLFNDHQDLVEELKHFLPDRTCPTPIAIVPTSAKPSSRHISGVSIRHSHKENMFKKEKTVTSQNNFHQSTIVKDERTSMEVENGHWKNVEKEKNKKEDWERKEKDKGEKRSVQSRDRELDTMYSLPHKRKCSRRSDESIPKHTRTGEVGGCAAKQSLQNTAIEDSNSLRNLYSQEWGFFERVKTKLSHRHTYQGFLKCIDLHTRSIFNRQQLQRVVVDILGKYPDLMDEFNEIVSRIANNDVDSREGGCTKLVKMENARENDTDYDREIEKENDRFIAEDQERYRERNKDRHHSNASLLPNKEKFMNKPISELDLSNCERCTPSYRLLPKRLTKSVASYCTDLAAELLNDNWVSVTSGRDDYSRHMRKNQYEEIIFRCEDDRFELDMLIESTAATTKRVKELLEKMQDNTIKRDGPIQVALKLIALISIACHGSYKFTMH